MSRITPPMRSEAEFTRIEKAATEIEKSRPTKWYIGFVVHQTPVEALAQVWALVAWMLAS